MLTQLKKPVTLILLGLAALVLTANALVFAPLVRMDRLSKQVEFAIFTWATDEHVCPDLVSYEELVSLGLLKQGLKNPYTKEPLRILGPMDKEEPGCIKYVPLGPRYPPKIESASHSIGSTGKRDSYTVLAYGKNFGCHSLRYYLLQSSNEEGGNYYEVPEEELSPEDKARAKLVEEKLVVRESPNMLYFFW